MNRVEKSGWIALGLTLLVGFVSLGMFMWKGPGGIDRNILHLTRPEIYEKVLIQAIPLLATLPEKATILSDDPRARGLSAALSPANFSFIYKEDQTLTIECGGGFQHYGYKLERGADSSFKFHFQNEGAKDKLIKSSGDR